MKTPEFPPPPPPPQPPTLADYPYYSAPVTVQRRSARVAWVIFRACLWTVFALSGIGLAICFLLPALAFFAAHPGLLLGVLFVLSFGLLMFVHYE